MSKNRLVLLSGGAVVALLLVGLAGGTLALAQESNPAADGQGFFGRRGSLGWDGGSWTMFDTAAEALGLTPTELFVELHDEGKTLSEVADEQGVGIDAVQEALDSNRAQAERQAIEQAVADGNLSQDEADWMLEGLDKGFMGGRHGMGPGGFGPDGGPHAAAE